MTTTRVRPNLEKRLELTKRGTGGLHSVVRYTLLCSRVFCLLPVTGVTKQLSDKLRFTLWSPYTFVYFISLSGQLLMTILSLYRLVTYGISLVDFTNFFFYTSGLFLSMILVYIAMSWPKLVKEVEIIEKDLPPLAKNVSRYCNITTFFVLFSALVEHYCSLFYGFSIAFSCMKDDIFNTFFVHYTPWLFDLTTYKLWKGILSEIFIIQSTFMWSYNDLLIMVVSIYLTEHFILHTQLLQKSLKMAHFSLMEFRMQYLKIVRLVKLINGHIGIYILTSFGCNLYWICLQLFNSLKKIGELEHTFYFTYSFTFLVVRTTLVLLLAARVQSSSLLPLTMLYEVPTDKFNIEVQRYIDQIIHLKVALSGLDFFYVTRTMILTLLGTIVTYEWYYCSLVDKYKYIYFMNIFTRLYLI